MAAPKTAPYGSWKSPIGADVVACGTITLEQIALEGGVAYWLEQRPAEGGRKVILRCRLGESPQDVTPPPFNVRTRVHEYGGGAFAVHGGTVFFANYADQRLYRQEAGCPPRPLTPGAEMRYADATVDARRRRLACVREDHSVPGGEPQNTLVSIDLERGGLGEVLASGQDFYSSPRPSPDGRHLAWLAWDHPRMPWDGCELWLAEVLGDGTLGSARRIAGGQTESVFQPEWSPDGVLHYASDRTGWWNLYRLRGERIEPLCQMAAEFGAPQWAFGMSRYAFVSSHRILCAYVQQETSHLGLLDSDTGCLEPLATPFTDILEVRAAQDYALILAGSPREAPAIRRVDLNTGQMQTLRRTSNV